VTQVTVEARTYDPLHRRRALYLKSYLDSLLLAIRNFYLGRQAGRHSTFFLLLAIRNFYLGRQAGRHSTFFFIYNVPGSSAMARLL
jgi:hypothetical protein